MSLPPIPTWASPPPTFIPEDQRAAALTLHLSPLAGLILPGLGNVLGPLMAWLFLRGRSHVLDAQGKESLNFQISFWLYGLLLGVLVFVLMVLGLLGGAAGAVTGRPEVGALAFLGTFASFLLLYLPALLLFSLLPTLLMIVAAVRVSGGQAYRYPLTIPFLR